MLCTEMLWCVFAAQQDAGHALRDEAFLHTPLNEWHDRENESNNSEVCFYSLKGKQLTLMRIIVTGI